MEQIDIWDLIQNKYFDKACEQADIQYTQTKDIFILRNKVYALFHLKKYEDAIKLTEQLIIDRNGETSTDFIFCGIANWLLNKRDVAIKLWQDARKCLYQDAAGGIDIEVILYFASVKIGDKRLKKEVVKNLNKLLKNKKGKGWPKQLGQYLLDSISKEDLLSYVSTILILKKRNLCQVRFVIAIKELERDNLENYMHQLEDIINLGSGSYLEEFFYLAQGELSLLAQI